MKNSYNSKIIIACDFSNKEQLYAFLQKMGNRKLFLKLGMEIIYKEGFSLIHEMKNLGHDVFLDLKLHDIPTTVKKAIISLISYKPDFITIHTSGGKKMMNYAIDAVKGSDTVLLGVTILTSISQEEWNEMGNKNYINDQVELFMKMAKESGLSAVVCSPLESHIARRNGLKSITPGVRMPEDGTDDQTRIMTPKKAIENGSSFLVIGRSITQEENPLKKYQEIEKSIL